MGTRRGRLLEIQQNRDGSRQAVLEYAGGQLPAAGQYLQAYNLVDRDSPAAVTLFPGSLQPLNGTPDRFLTAPDLPSSWAPGDELILRGPLGRGFSIPDSRGRAVLAAFTTHSAHLLPVAGEVLAGGGEVALFTDGEFPRLPASIEISPLQDLAEALRWADYVACTAAPGRLAHAHELIGDGYGLKAVQLLVLAHMPCGALAGCGVCAFRLGRGKLKLACEAGPVFDWRDL